MATTRTKKRALYVAAESAYSTDPSSNGSGYLYVPVLELGLLQDGMSQLETNYFTGRNYPTAPIAGTDGWSFDVTIPMTGLGVAAGVATTPSATEDWQGTFWKHTFGTVAQNAGVAVSSTGSSSAITFASDLYDIQQLLCVYEAALPTATAVRAQWTEVVTDSTGGVYVINPTWAANPTSAAVAYGQILYRDTAVGASLSFVFVQDSTTYLLSGGRCTAMTIDATARQKIMIKMTFSGNTKTVDATKSSLPNAAPSLAPMKTELSPIWIGGTNYATNKIQIDFGLAAAEQDSTAAVGGRAEFELMSIKPKITIEPLFTPALQDLKRAATTGNRCLIQFGAGALSGGVLNTSCLAFNEVVASESNPVDDNNRIRLGQTFMATDAGYFSGSTLARFVQYARA